ncbi:MAG: DUF2513 domain-containing protein [Candidatus Korobacteraceae bacterium]
MKRDLNLIREILLHIESGEEYDGTREFYFTTPEEMGLTGGFTPEEFVYNYTLLIENGYIDGAATVMGQVTVRRLTSSGHDFLDDIRDPGVWKQVRNRLGSLPGVALTIVAEVAKSEIRKHLGLP